MRVRKDRQEKRKTDTSEEENRYERREGKQIQQAKVETKVVEEKATDDGRKTDTKNNTQNWC